MTTSNAVINTIKSGYTFLAFFNSKEVFTVKGFATARKARNYARKYNVIIFEQLPQGIAEYQNWD